VIEIYQMEDCPYCVKVRSALYEMGVDYVVRNISSEATWKKLVELGGDDQVPFLVDAEKGVRMYESDDIIDYVKRTYGGVAGRRG